MPGISTPHEVFAIRYATVARRSAENFIGGDAHETGERMDYFVSLCATPSALM